MNENVEQRAAELADEIRHALLWAAREHGQDQAELMRKALELACGH